MIKLAFVATGYIVDYDGVSVFIENLLKNFLKEKDVQDKKIYIDIYTNQTAQELLKKRVDTQKTDNINFITIKSGRFVKFLDLQLHLLRKKYDHIFMPTPMPVFFTRGKVTKVVLDLTIKQTPEFFSKAFHLYIDFLIWYMKKFDYAIGYISKQTKDDLEKFYSITDKNKKLLFFENGVPFKVQSYNRPTDEEVEKKFSSSTLEFVAVGRINRSKGFDRILDFLDQLDIYLEDEKRLKKTVLNIVGKQTDETQELFKQKSYKNIDLIFHGYVDDKKLNNLYKNSHYCIFLSRNEGYGLPLIEALWFKTVVIISDLPVFSEIIGEDYPKFSDKTGYKDAIVEFVKKSYFDKSYQKELYTIIEDRVKKAKKAYTNASKTLLELIK